MASFQGVKLYYVHKLLFIQGISEVSSFLGVRIKGSTVYKGVLISGDFPLYTEVSSRGFTVHRSVLISGGWNRGVSLYTKVSSFLGVGIKVPLYREVSSFQGVGIEEFHRIQRCPRFRRLE